MRLLVFLLVIAAMAAVFVVAGCSSGKPAYNNGGGDSTGDGLEKAVIFKSQSCGCCANYVSYMKRQKGFDVSTTNLEDLSSLKDKYGIPSGMQACHTTIIGNYFVEGHVPVEAIRKMLDEKPAVRGIALPGMPEAAPGMPGGKGKEFEIYAVANDGSTSLFMKI